MQNLICAIALGVVAASAAFGEELRNGTFYLPEPLAADYDRLWTEGRMR